MAASHPASLPSPLSLPSSQLGLVPPAPAGPVDKPPIISALRPDLEFNYTNAELMEPRIATTLNPASPLYLCLLSPDCLPPAVLCTFPGTCGAYSGKLVTPAFNSMRESVMVCMCECVRWVQAGDEETSNDVVNLTSFRQTIIKT